MFQRRTLSLVCLSLSLPMLLALPVHAQNPVHNAVQSPAHNAAHNAALQAADNPATSVSAAKGKTGVQQSAYNESRRKPRWFDERRQRETQHENAAGSGFERLSYTPYVGESAAGSGSCAYSQNSYTYSCR
jgi:hypothetical protein